MTNGYIIKYNHEMTTKDYKFLDENTIQNLLAKLLEIE